MLLSITRSARYNILSIGCNIYLPKLSYIFKPLIRHQTTEAKRDRIKASTIPKDASSTFIHEFERAKIPFTPAGIRILEQACTDFTHDEIFNPTSLDTYELYYLISAQVPENSDDKKPIKEDKNGKERSKSPRNFMRDRLARERYERYKVYLIWEALYHHSPMFRTLLEYEEAQQDTCTPIALIGTESLENCGVWMLLGHFYRWGMLERESVDGLPDPILYLKKGLEIV
ncbi:hypothetical protein TWF694_002083 [Orbilia ellipsospora]|uniref:Uncharacterized protein n=1 Tax=Orbilia ellipsospora TaxID=2528407 RepID=A0AAV9X4Q5_9PEZI